MSYASAHFPTGIRASIKKNAGAFPSKLHSVRVSYHSKCKCLKLKLYPDLGSLGCALKYGGSELKLPLMFKVPPRISIRRCSNVSVIKSNYPQNADFPRYYSKKEKKPFPVPVVELRRAARERQKSRKGKPKNPVLPPRNGLLISKLIPVAYEVLNARVTLINNLKKLLKVVPVHACK